MSAFGFWVTKFVYISLSVLVELLEKSRWDDSCVMLHCNPETNGIRNTILTLSSSIELFKAAMGNICMRNIFTMFALRWRGLNHFVPAE